MLSPSRFVWDSIPLLASVHIPWRFLSLAVFSSAAVSGFLIKTIKSKKINLVIYGLLIGLTLYGNRNHLRINEIRVYNQAFFQNYIGVATGWNEHLPIWIKKIPKSFPDKKVEVISGNCAITNLINQSNLTIFNANCQDEAKIQLNTAYYPRWQVLDNNQIITNQVKKNLETSNGLIQFSLNSGQHQVKAIFGKTAVFSQLPLSHR